MGSRSDRPPTRVVNVRSERCDAYIGRGSPHGNPYALGVDGDREEVVRKFGVHFEERLRLDPEYRALVLTLAGKALG